MVFDYQSLINQTNFTFQSDRTYYCSNSVNLAGTNWLEACVIKFSKNSSQIKITGSGATLNCRTGPWHNAILTAEDDQSVGDSITENGSPSGYYGNYYLYVDYASSSNISTLNNLNIRYAKYGVYYNQGTNHVLSHAQLVSCQNGISGFQEDVYLRNVLGASCSNIIEGNLTTIRAENCTFAASTYLGGGFYTPTLLFTNCLISGIAHAYSYSGTNSAAVGSSDFQAVANGNYYLINNSPYRDFGTTNINPGLAADLKSLTTYPPILLSNPITNDTTLTPQAGRDSDTPDAGFHYSPIDFILSGGVPITNATLTLTSSVVVGVSSSAGVGLKMRTGSHLISVGSPVAVNRLLRVDSVQEALGSSATKTALFADDLVSGTQPDARLRFTEMTLLPNTGSQVSGGSKLAFLAAQDCRFLAEGLSWNVTGGSGRSIALTNNLFERTTNIFGTGADPVSLDARNNLFWNGGISFKPVGTNTWTWYDNAFDGTGISTNSNTFTNNYNGYLGVSEFPAHGTNDVVTSLTWRTWTLGNYYQPTNSAFTNAGSRTADLAGLYHYCIFTNQIKETTNKVSLGLHYVALGANGNPDDYDGDGIPDYLEDLNGNGSLDAGETDWTSGNTYRADLNDYLVRVQGRNLSVTNSLADTNNLVNLRVYTPLK